MFKKFQLITSPARARWGVQGKQNPHCLAWFDDPRKFGLRKLCVSDRCLTFFGWETRGGFHQVHHHLYKGWVKDKGGKLLFKKGEIYCGGKARWTLAHRWMSTPSLVEIRSMHTKRTVDVYLKNSKFLTFVQGLLKNFLRHRLRKII